MVTEGTLVALYRPVAPVTGGAAGSTACAMAGARTGPTAGATAAAAGILGTGLGGTKVATMGVTMGTSGTACVMMWYTGSTSSIETPGAAAGGVTSAPAGHTVV